MYLHLMIGAGALVAILIVSNSSKGFFDDDNEDFRDGYTAGFFTPGPFTILALAGVIATQV